MNRGIGRRTVVERVARSVYARLVAALTVFGAVVMAIVMAAAVTELGGKVSDDWRAFPLFLDLTWLLVAVAALAASLAGLAAMLRHPRHQLAFGLALAAGLRLGAAWLIDAPFTADWRAYHQMAERIANGGEHWSNIPTGYQMVLAIPYALIGPYPWVAELVNVGFGVATAWLVFWLARRVFGEPAAGAALFLFAIAPDQVLMTPVIATEPLYTLALTLGVAMTFTPRLAATVVAAIALGASQYVRTTTMLLVPAFLAVIPLLSRWRMRLVVFLAVLVIALSPIVRHNLIQYGDFSVSTSRRGAWSLLVGTNQEYSGAYNAKDVGDQARHQWSAEAAQIAQAEAIRRITSDPAAFGALFVRKVFSFSASGDYAVWIAVPGATQAAKSGLALISQAIYVAIVVLATVTAWRMRSRPIVVLTLAVMTILVLAHGVLEVSPRYHASIIPLLCVLAGAQAARWGIEGGARRPTVNETGTDSIGPTAHAPPSAPGPEGEPAA